mmetsp:Transcript_31564/g.58015  ORF Transcript_31564/g.58015 Transcript_31564/m.58015 type:complete len:150 (+) Transcript_31564:55-504(+)
MGLGPSSCCTNLQKDLYRQEIQTGAMQISTMEDLQKGHIEKWSAPGRYETNQRLGLDLATLDCCANPAIAADGSVGGLQPGVVAATAEGGHISALRGAEPDGPRWTFEQQDTPNPTTPWPRSDIRPDTRPDPSFANDGPGTVKAPRSVR